MYGNDYADIVIGQVEFLEDVMSEESLDDGFNFEESRYYDGYQESLID